MKNKYIMQLFNNLPYLSVGLDVGADFTWMSIARPDGTFIGKPFKIMHADPQSGDLAVSKIKEAQEACSLESRCFLESTGSCHIPLLCFLTDKGFNCSVINPIITKNSTNVNIRKVHNDRFDSRKAALIGLNASVKASIVPDDEVIGLRSLVRDYYYFKDQQSAIALKLNAELRVSFPQYLKAFSTITAKTSLMLLEKYPLPGDILAAEKDAAVEAIRVSARFGQARAEKKYNAIAAAARDAAIFGRALPGSAVRIRLYVGTCQECRKHLDSILKELHKATDDLENTETRSRITLLQTLHEIGFLSAAVLAAEMGSFDLFSSPKKLYAYFGLDPAVKQSGKFTGDHVHISKRGSSLARRILHMAALNNLKVDSTTKEPVNPVIHSYYMEKCKNKKKIINLLMP